MKPGIGTYCFRWSIGHKDRTPEKPMTAMDVLNFGIAENCEVIQYADNLPLDRLKKSEIESLTACAKSNGVALELGTQSFNSSQVEEYLKIAELIDARILRIALDTADANTPIIELATQFRPLLKKAEEIHCRIAIENHFNYPSRRMVELLNEVNSPSLGVCLDVANSICAQEWPMETVKILAPYSINLHLKDYEIVPDFYGAGFSITGRPLGEGRTNTDEILNALPTHDETMSVIVEQWLPYQENFSATNAMEIEWTRKNLAEARKRIKAFKNKV